MGHESSTYFKRSDSARAMRFRSTTLDARKMLAPHLELAFTSTAKSSGKLDSCLWIPYLTASRKSPGAERIRLTNGFTRHLRTLSRTKLEGYTHGTQTPDRNEL